MALIWRSLVWSCLDDLRQDASADSITVHAAKGDATSRVKWHDHVPRDWRANGKGTDGEGPVMKVDASLERKGSRVYDGLGPSSTGRLLNGPWWQLAMAPAHMGGPKRTQRDFGSPSSQHGSQLRQYFSSKKAAGDAQLYWKSS